MCHSELARLIKLIYKRMAAAGMVSAGNRAVVIMFVIYVLGTLASMYLVHVISAYMRDHKEGIRSVFIGRD
jgi:hypothetical protein